MRAGENWMKARNWLWWSGRLAELFILTMWHTIQTEIALWIKSKQKDLVKALARDLIEAFKARLNFRRQQRNNLLYYECFK
jgi:hypothetical protein